MTHARKHFRLVPQLKDDFIVSMCVNDGRVWVATEREVYRSDRAGDKLVPVKFELPENRNED